MDAWRRLFGSWVALHLTESPTTFVLLYGAEDLRNQRVALNLQSVLKEKTNQDLLKKATIYDRTTEEFFTQRAAGWSLRQYGKTNLQWVEELMKELALSPSA